MPATFCVPEIFLDANATTPVLPEISQLMEDVCCVQFGNPSSPHLAALTPKQILDTTRASALALFNHPPGQIIFNSGATEGINTAVFSVLQAHLGQDCTGKFLLYGATEHKAVPEALKYWNTVLQLGAQLIAIPVDSRGQLDLQFLGEHVADALIVCTMGANNETGVVADLPALNQCIRKASLRVPWLMDCVQVLGKVPLDLTAIDVDYATFSAHKLYGPKGVGCLYVHEQATYSPLTVGGGQEQGARGGTENVAGIAALGRIFQWLLSSSSDLGKGPFASMTKLQNYREQLLNALRVLFPNLALNQPYPDSLPTTLNFSVPDFSSAQLISMFDAAGIRVSAGSACSTGKPKSFVLDAMGLPAWQSEGAIRLSFGPATSAAYIDSAATRIRELAKRVNAIDPTPRGLLVPQPTASNFTVYAVKDVERAQLYVFGHQDDHADWLASNFPTAVWNYIDTHELTIDDWHLSRSPDQAMSITNRRTGRSVELGINGVSFTETEKQSVDVIALMDIQADVDCLVDVREPLETAAQPIIAPFHHGCTASRAEWIRFLLSTPERTEGRYVTICRSGGRSSVIAALAAKLGAPKQYSAELGVTHLLQKVICSKA